MQYLAHGGYESSVSGDDMSSVIVAGLGFLAIGLLLGYVLGSGRVPGVSSKTSKKSKK